MKTKAVRLYGKDDLRLEEFDLAPLKQDEIRIKIIADSVGEIIFGDAVMECTGEVIIR